VRVALAALFASMLLAIGASASAKDMTRAEALTALGDTANAERRRDAVRALGDVGTMDDVATLVRALRDDDRMVRALADRSIWEIWSRSGDPGVDRLMTLGIEQMAARAGDEAIETFTQVIERRPEFAEGWNKRATMYYVMGLYEKSLADCDEVMKRNPYHWGALSGYGMIHLQLGNPERALEYFERALAINPNLDSVRAAVEELRQLMIERRRNTL
jgi:tetratricopeptide (TPR) repeat protein